jgi:hypothetical protein
VCVHRPCVEAAALECLVAASLCICMGPPTHTHSITDASVTAHPDLEGTHDARAGLHVHWGLLHGGGGAAAASRMHIDWA